LEVNKKLICIVCPIGCNLEISYNECEIQNIQGYLCPRGVEYAEKELFNPERTLTTSVHVMNGEMPLASVRTTKPIPKHLTRRVVGKLKKIHMEAPVKFGQVIIKDVEGSGVDVVTTREVRRRTS